MIINQIKDGGVQMYIVAEELAQIASLMDRAAGTATDSMDADGDTSDTFQLELLAAAFTAAAVACLGQQGFKAWYERKNTTPTFHLPE